MRYGLVVLLLVAGCGYFPVIQPQAPVTVVAAPPGGAAVTNGQVTQELRPADGYTQNDDGSITKNGTTIVIVRQPSGYPYTWAGGWWW